MTSFCVTMESLGPVTLDVVAAIEGFRMLICAGGLRVVGGNGLFDSKRLRSFCFPPACAESTSASVTSGASSNVSARRCLSSSFDMIQGCPSPTSQFMCDGVFSALATQP